MCARPSRRAEAVARYERKDAFHQRAKREGYRSRAAYKLIEIDRAQRLLRPGLRVADLGCWPGGWMQVAARVVGARGKVVGVDRAALDPPLEEPNADALVGDLEDPALAGRLREALGGPADLVLSDAAPKLTGLRDRDRALEERLLEAIEALLPALLRPGGDLVVKLLEGPEAQEISRRIGSRFARRKSVKSKATRKGSSERYLVARDYRGPE